MLYEVITVSEDGLKTYLHFDEANSPLPSNTVNTIAVDPVTGEVFFGTVITSYSIHYTKLYEHKYL